MNKKKSLIVTSIVQIIASIYSMIFAKKIFNNNYVVEEMFDQYQDNIINIINNIGPILIFIFSLVCMILAIIMINIVLKKDFNENKRHLLILSICSFLFTQSEIVTFASLFNIIILLKKDNKKRANKKIPYLEKHNSSFKEKLLGLGLILFYLSDYLWADFIPGNISILVLIIFELSLILLSIFIYYKDIKRDFIDVKNNFKIYFKYALSRWGYMLLAVLVYGIIMSIFNIDSESVNQETLVQLPLLYLLPAAIIQAPIVEETIFRGVLRKIFTNDKLFIFVSSFLFGIVHVVYEATIIDALIASIPYVIMGAFMAHAYVKTNNLITSMIIHALQNSMASLLIIFLGF